MRRREFIARMESAAAWPASAFAQQARLFRVALLMDGPFTAVRSFRARLEQLGYAEGRNLELIERWTDGRADLLAQFATELANDRPDAIVTYGSRATLA